MALGYLGIGTLIGFLAALALALTGGGLVLALGTLSAVGTLSVLAAMVAGARCPSAKVRAESTT
ncbi:MAG: hypothetical protein QNJ13_06085 [Paracoccaceae bacterium]|nr:hypothetical protein [Paracoccaceae bacterium]